MNLTHQQEKEQRMKREEHHQEEHHQLVLANEALKRERQWLDKNIDLLADSVDPPLSTGEGNSEIDSWFAKVGQHLSH